MAENGINGTQEKTLSVSQALQVYTQLLNRLTMTRAGVTFTGKRDLYETLGYLRDLRYEDYYERYLRGGIAARIIDAFPAATWRLTPVVSEVGKADETVKSPFEQAWETLATRLRVWHALARVDRLASLGHYAVLVIGVRGQTDWGTEAMRVGTPDNVLYLKAYSEQHATIQSLVSEDTPLFGRPARYNIDFSRKQGNALFDSTLRPMLGARYGSLMPVHASRVIHVTENGLEDDIIGTPRLRAVWNYLDDLEKVIGGSGEMFWQDAKRRLVLSLQADATLSSDQATALSAEVDEFVHEMRNFLRVQGMDVTQLEGRIPDPTGNVDKILDLIAGTIGMPKRKLVGSERGELASNQDEQNWATTITERQQQYAEPGILRPLLDWLIQYNGLPAPKDGYTVEWQPLLGISEKEQSEVALNWARTLKEYAGTTGSPQDVLPLEVFLEDICEFPKEQVQRIMELLAEGLVEEDEIEEESAEAASEEGAAA